MLFCQYFMVLHLVYFKQVPNPCFAWAQISEGSAVSPLIMQCNFASEGGDGVTSHTAAAVGELQFLDCTHIPRYLQTLKPSIFTVYALRIKHHLPVQTSDNKINLPGPKMTCPDFVIII